MDYARQSSSKTQTSWNRHTEEVYGSWLSILPAAASNEDGTSLSFSPCALRG
ncbi:hypothetical protein M422DRAFT_37866 [Sphaerobolus stellatus SS14]|uniref:Uncharacterized protein n=1 Tax=Sphaerobolus stellatus (strain SS14) TaxID=990650 RepID=A0A0C9UE15_SPHS4|nr:hypothetical protein M422DRAFT_37866 [Sphaerobolus stellatus SS14]